MLEGWILTAAVLLVAIVTVGHTYVQQKRVIGGCLTACSYCQKIRVSSEVWDQLEKFVADRTLVVFTHGVCPDCFQKAIQRAPEGERRDTPAE